MPPADGLREFRDFLVFAHFAHGVHRICDRRKNVRAGFVLWRAHHVPQRAERLSTSAWPWQHRQELPECDRCAVHRALPFFRMRYVTEVRDAPTITRGAQARERVDAVFEHVARASTGCALDCSAGRSARQCQRRFGSLLHENRISCVKNRFCQVPKFGQPVPKRESASKLRSGATKNDSGMNFRIISRFIRARSRTLNALLSSAIDDEALRGSNTIFHARFHTAHAAHKV
mmetsp:Transcript_7147/g.22372  ORF Transcript_7147/g.22372 Transcript_7147/m.22372 type:complete len:231 (-) Transcript_7147:213-905(-)